MAKPSRIRKPGLLREKRAAGRDNITKRDWSKNPLGEVSVKSPGPTKLLKFYTSVGGAGSAELYRQHKILEEKITRLIKARPSRDKGLQIVKGTNDGHYYAKVKSIQTDKPIFIRIDKQEFIDAVRFLEEGPSGGKTPALLLERRVREIGDITKRDWSQNPLGKFFSKKPPGTLKSLRFYASQKQVGDAELYNQYKLFEAKIRRLINVRSTDWVIDIVKSKQKRYFVKIKSSYTDRHTPESAIFIRIDDPSFKKSVKFLEQQGKPRFRNKQVKR